MKFNRVVHQAAMLTEVAKIVIPLEGQKLVRGFFFFRFLELREE
jgi:hypothetical protein